MCFAFHRVKVFHHIFPFYFPPSQENLFNRITTISQKAILSIRRKLICPNSCQYQSGIRMLVHPGCVNIAKRARCGVGGLGEKFRMQNPNLTISEIEENIGKEMRKKQPTKKIRKIVLLFFEIIEKHIYWCLPWVPDTELQKPL